MWLASLAPSPKPNTYPRAVAVSRILLHKTTLFVEIPSVTASTVCDSRTWCMNSSHNAYKMFLQQKPAKCLGHDTSFIWKRLFQQTPKDKQISSEKGWIKAIHHFRQWEHMWTEWLTEELSKQMSISNILQIAPCRWMWVSLPRQCARTLPAALEPSLSNQECLAYSKWWWQVPKSLMSFWRTFVPRKIWAGPWGQRLPFVVLESTSASACYLVTWTCEVTCIHLHKHCDDHTLIMYISTVTFTQVSIKLSPSQGAVTSRHRAGLSILSFPSEIHTAHSLASCIPIHPKGYRSQIYLTGTAVCHYSFHPLVSRRVPRGTPKSPQKSNGIAGVN